jgi:hypothetical protein
MQKFLIFNFSFLSEFKEKLKDKFVKFQPLMEAKTFSGDFFKFVVSWSLRLWRATQIVKDFFDLLDD